MPMIDVTAIEGTFADPQALAQVVAAAVMRIEQVPDIPMFRQNTAGFVHEIPAGTLADVNGSDAHVRVQVLTNAGALDRDKQLAIVAELTRLVAAAAGDPDIADRTWVLRHRGPGRWLGPARICPYQHRPRHGGTERNRRTLHSSGRLTPAAWLGPNPDRPTSGPPCRSGSSELTSSGYRVPFRLPVGDPRQVDRVERLVRGAKTLGDSAGEPTPSPDNPAGAVCSKDQYR